MNSPSFEDEPVLKFFEASTRNLLTAGAAAHVRHHVALSVVGADRLPESGYIRPKVAQENLIRSSGRPFTIVRATQYFEFVGAIADSGLAGDTIDSPAPTLMQPIAADDVALVEARNDTVDLAGPEPIRLDELVRPSFAATGDTRPVKTDPQAQYFGTATDDRSLTPGDNPRLGSTRFEDWLSRSRE